MANWRSDERLLASGNAADFGVFYERHLDAVTAYLGRRTRRPDLTYDLVAETFARALERRDQYDARRGPAVAWLLGIARHLHVDALRKGRVANEARERLGLERIELDDEQLARVEERSRIDLRTALGQLPLAQREAVLLRVLEEQPYLLIAVRIGCSEASVRQRVYRGLAALRGLVRASA